MKWDMVLLNMEIPHPVHYMTSESHYRKAAPRFFLSLLGTIPKAKAKSDLEAIRRIMDLKTAGKVICIYPEGQMTWDGRIMPLFYSTAKLLRLLKVPVYVPVFSGGHAAQPRWGKERRSGPIELTIHPLFRDGKELKKQTPDEIFNRISAVLSNDDYRLIRESGWEYRSDSLAEYLENILFICPECHTVASLGSEGNRLSCSHCGFAQELNSRYEFLDREGNPGRFTDPAEWNEWQRGILKELLEVYRKGSSDSPFMVDRDVTIKTGHRKDPMKNWAEKGELALFRDHILLRNDGDEVRIIPLEEISGIHVMTRQKLEFYHDRTLYAFYFPNLRISGYKWLCALRTLELPSTYAWPAENTERI